MGMLQYGIENINIAVAINRNTIPYQYNNIIPIPGAVSLSLSPSISQFDITTGFGENSPQRLDKGYEGTLELLGVPFSFLQQIFDCDMDENSCLKTEYAIHNTKHFALLGQLKTDQLNRRFCFYNCIIEKPVLKYQSNSNSINANSQSLDIAILPRSDHKIKSSIAESNKPTIIQYKDSIIGMNINKPTDHDYQREVYENWFNIKYLNRDYIAE